MTKLQIKTVFMDLINKTGIIFIWKQQKQIERLITAKFIAFILR